MDYGRKGISNQRDRIAIRNAKRRRRRNMQILKITLLIFLIIGLLGIIGGGLVIKNIIDKAPKVTADDLKPSAYTTTVYANDGKKVLATFVDAGSNRIFVGIEDIPEELQNAFIAIEDARFREHKGIDTKGIIRAGVTGIMSGGDFSQGASTITQQLIKNCVFPDFVNETKMERVERKIQEIYLALKIEKEINDKDVILENYLNMINLGQNTLGVQTAAKRYFGKSVSKLTLSECATIAAITQSPEYLNPITNPEENNKRRIKVLDNMLEQGFIDQAAHDEAIADDVYSRIQESNKEYKDSLTVNSYFVDELARQVVRDLVDKLGYTEEQAHNAMYSGGLKIISTQDTRMQKICEEELNRSSNYPSQVKWGVDCAISIIHEDGTQENYDTNTLKNYVSKNYGQKYGSTFSSKSEAKKMVNRYIKSLKSSENDTVVKRVNYNPQPQASFVVMDQKTGQVKALVGGRGKKTSDMSFNRATQAGRQPGSCFKVLSTYVPALDDYGDTLATVIQDGAYKYANGQTVHNWWGSGSKGNMTIRECITQSANVCTVKKLTEITPALGYKYLTKKFNFTTLTKDADMYQPLALGGVSKGVYNLQITAAYAAIANKGVYTEPTLYTEIYDHNGNLLFENTPKTNRALKATTAALITSAMVDVITKGTGTQARMSNMQVAGKTGTSQKSRDLWLCAYTPYLTASIWTGYDDEQPMEHLDQSFHNRLWKKIMTRIHDGYKYKSFSMPKSLETRSICKSTGLLATNTCNAYREYFASGTAPTRACKGHQSEKKDDQKDKDNDKSDNTTPEGTNPDEGTGETANPQPET